MWVCVRPMTLEVQKHHIQVWSSKPPEPKQTDRQERAEPKETKSSPTASQWGWHGSSGHRQWLTSSGSYRELWPNQVHGLTLQVLTCICSKSGSMICWVSLKTVSALKTIPWLPECSCRPEAMILCLPNPKRRLRRFLQRIQGHTNHWT